jgi:GDPmannose 4,6-dehydratase
MPPVAFVTGITGQDGSYLTELLLSKGYEVHGLMRRASTFNTDRIDHVYQDPHDPARRLYLHFGDLTDGSMLARLVGDVKPDELYNLGAQTHVGVSFDMPEYTANATALGTLRLLESVREAHVRPRIYQASSSEMFGNVPAPQDEETPFNPASPYAVAKVFAHQMAGLYREAYGMYVVRGILFNHESPRRGPTFVTRKVTHTVARICAGKEDRVYLGNLEASRDWGYAPEYVEAMWRMLQDGEPRDYVLATGDSHTVQELCEAAFGLVGLDWRNHVEVDPRYLRPKDVGLLAGDASRAREEIGWQPKVRFPQLIQIMLEADLRAQGLDPGEYLTQPAMDHRPEWARIP